MEIGSFLKKSHFWHGAMTITVRADEGEALWKEAQIDLLESTTGSYGLDAPWGRSRNWWGGGDKVPSISVGLNKP